MLESLSFFLKNIACSNCTSNEFEECTEKEDYKSWKMYLKEYELYSAITLYNENLNKDISYLIQKNESIILLDENKEIFIKLEYLSNSEEDGTPIMVPTDEYQDLYEKIENMEKKFDKSRNANYIGTYNLKKSK